MNFRYVSFVDNTKAVWIAMSFAQSGGGHVYGQAGNSKLSRFCNYS